MEDCIQYIMRANVETRTKKLYILHKLLLQACAYLRRPLFRPTSTYISGSFCEREPNPIQI